MTGQTPALAYQPGLTSLRARLGDTVPFTKTEITALGQDAAWETSCVDCPKDFLSPSDRTLRLDAVGHPHIAYGGDHLYYAWYDGAAWHFETADPAAPVGRHAALALDDEGNPHISYAVATSGSVVMIIRYAYRNSAGVWTLQDVAVGGEEDGWTLRPRGSSAIALNAASQPCIAYGWKITQGIAYTGQLKYTCRVDGDWETPQILAQGSMVFPDGISLAFDAQGTPHITYGHEYTYYVGPGAGNCWPEYNWYCEDVPTDYGNAISSMTLNSQGRPHVTYLKNDAGRTYVMYAQRNETSWEKETATSVYYYNGTSYAAAAIALDAADRPRITYLTDGHYATGSLNLVAWTGSAWENQTLNDHVEIPPSVATHHSLALDAAGSPHIAYFEEHGLNYAYWDGSAWQDRLLDPGHIENGVMSGRYNSAAVDAEGGTHIGYCSDQHPCLQYAYHDGDGWTFQRPLTDTNFYAGLYTSLALDAAGRPHMAYDGRGYAASNAPFLGYARWTGDEWILEVVEENIARRDSNPTVGPTSLALDAAGRPHIAYIADPTPTEDAIRYATWSGSEWLTQTVTRDSGYQNALALALDVSGQPHLVYTNGAARGYCPVYAVLQEGEWVTTTLAAVSPSCGTSAMDLALDAAGRPHIVYDCNVPNSSPVAHELRYAILDGGVWLSETVPVLGDSWNMALDAAGDPHLSFLANGVQYAVRKGDVWHVQTVHTGPIYYDHSLALDRWGLAHITYLDENDGDLHIARQTLPPLTLTKQASPQDGLCAGDVVTFTLELGSAGLDAALCDPLPTGLTYITGSLASTVAPPPLYVGDAPTGTLSFTTTCGGGQGAIFWQGMLLTGTQIITFQAHLDTESSLVNTAWLTDAVYTRAISASVILNPQQVYLPLVLRDY